MTYERIEQVVAELTDALAAVARSRGWPSSSLRIDRDAWIAHGGRLELDALGPGGQPAVPAGAACDALASELARVHESERVPWSSLSVELRWDLRSASWQWTFGTAFEPPESSDQTSAS